MKIIESDGGPLIGLNRCDLQDWSGIEGKRFIGHASPFSDDYDAVKSAMRGGRRTLGSLAKITGSTHEGFLINLPLPTFIVASDDRSVHLAQIWCSEVDWSESMVTTRCFNEGEKEEDKIVLDVKAGGFLLFDSACPAGWLEDDFLSFDLSAGRYICESAIWNVKGQADLIIIKMEKI